MGATKMLDFRLPNEPCRREGRSDGDEGPGDDGEGVRGQEGEFGDDKTEEERDDDGVVWSEVDIGCSGAARRPSGG